MTSIRLAEPGDRDAIRGLIAEIRATLGERSDMAEIDRMLSDQLQHHSLEFLLALEGGQPVGLVSLAFAPTTQACSPFAWLDDLFVRPGHRRRGLGSELLAAARARATARGAHELRLSAPMGDAVLIALYRRAGFAVQGQALLVNALGDLGEHP